MSDKAIASAASAQFAGRLARLRISYGQSIGVPNLSQRAFAKKIGIESERLGTYERGEREPPLWVLIEIKRLTGISLDELIAGGEPSKPAVVGTPRHYGLRLRTGRLALGMSIAEAAQVARISTAMFEAFEEERELPDTQSLFQISTSLDLPSDFILSGNYGALSGRMMQRIIDLGGTPGAPEPARELRMVLQDPQKLDKKTLHEQQDALFLARTLRNPN